MALGDLTLIQVQILNLLRDSRPHRCGPRDMPHVRFPTIKQLARLGYVDLTGLRGQWRAVISDAGLKRLRAHHATAAIRVAS